MKILCVLLSDSADYFRINAKTPFRREVLNLAYANFAKIGKKFGFEVIFAKFNNLKGAKINKYWFFDKKWVLSNKKVNPDLFFDKFELGKKQTILKKKLSKKSILINNYNLEIFCKDKFAQSEEFSNFITKTYFVKNKKQFLMSIKKLKSERLILKPRFGLGGVGIKIFDKNNLPNFSRGEYVIQEFLDSSKGIPKTKVKNIHDLRCVVLNGKIMYSFVRVSQGGLMANINQGGKMVTIPIPKKIKKLVKLIDKHMKKFGFRLYSTDFFFANGRFYLIEINSKPGFDVCGDFGYAWAENSFFKNFFKELKKINK